MSKPVKYSLDLYFYFNCRKRNMLQIIFAYVMITNILCMKRKPSAFEKKRFVQSLLGIKHRHNLSFSELNHLRLLQFMKIPINTIKHTIVPELNIIGSTRNKSRFDEQFECVASYNEDCYKMVVMFRNNQYVAHKLTDYPLSIRFNEETNKFVLDLCKWGSICNNGTLVFGNKHSDIDWRQIPKIFTRIESYAHYVDLRNIDADCNINEINFYHLKRIKIGRLPPRLTSIALLTGCYRAEFIGDYSKLRGLQNLWANGQYLRAITLRGYFPDICQPKWLLGFRNMKNLRTMECTGYGHLDDIIPLFLNENPKRTANSSDDSFTVVIEQFGLKYYLDINRDGLQTHGLLW